MTNKLPEALELAAELEKYRPIPGAGYSMKAAAALLRTQHALLERALSDLRWAADRVPSADGPFRGTLAALNQHLDQP